MLEMWGYFLASMSPLLFATLRVSTPLVFASLGGWLSERSGIVNIALEGWMLVGAFVAVVVTYQMHSPFLGAFAAMGAAAFCSIFYAFFVIEMKANQIVIGTAMNLFAMGITPLCTKILYHSSTLTPSIPLQDRFQVAPLWIMLGCVLILALISHWTPLGLWLKFAGDHPDALESAGVRVRRIRWFAVVCGGALAGLGGASLSIWLSSAFSRNMTAGRGFIAIAALIFGKWRVLPTALACLLFGFFEAAQMRFQNWVFWGQEPIPAQWVQMFPYFLTLVILSGCIGSIQPPPALGRSEEQLRSSSS